ncbi:MAG: carboxypeptidase-like regulatory domain-containing protein [Planctomycetaceae bacterium]|nr:carboxypeptidase-like regulatory domain-containing protein [Planctomycetaceae bacterium]
MKIVRVFPLLLLCCIVSLGCGTGKTKTYDCTGTVTLDGDPVDQASVTFINFSLPAPVSARTDSSGKFTLKSEPGEFDVSVAKFTGNATADNPYVRSTNTLPEKYGDIKTSGFKVKVETDSSKNVYEFKLEK